MTFPHKDMIFMNRCLELAQRGRGMVAPNPMVGAVLVYEDRIIGEGYHEIYGKAHAEVNCIKSVQPNDLQYIAQSTIYVSLEPCAHFGKTPPCADLIIEHKIPKVVIGCRDSYDQVNGKGVQKLQQAGIEVVVGVLETEAVDINKRFFTFHQKKRPFIILKWAETANGWIGRKSSERLMISGKSTQILVHKWRSEEQAILVGTQTAMKDNPHLTDRYFNKRQPIRIVLDRSLKIPADYHIMNNHAETIIMNEHINQEKDNIRWIKVEDWSLDTLLQKWYALNIQSILVEGGASLLNQFIQEDIWDEIRVIKNNRNELVEDGIAAPRLPKSLLVETLPIEKDTIYTYVPFRNVHQ